MSKLSNFQVGSPTVAAGGRRIQQIHATYANRNAIFTSTSIGLREKRQDSRIFAIETGDVRLEGQVAGDQACKVARQRPLSFVGGAIVGILALDISQDPLKSWIEEQAAESGLAFRAARKKLEAAQNVSES